MAFGVPGALMVASIFVFVGGKSLYTVKKPAGNVIVEVAKCVLVRISIDLIKRGIIFLSFVERNLREIKTRSKTAVALARLC